MGFHFLKSVAMLVAVLITQAACATDQPRWNTPSTPPAPPSYPVIQQGGPIQIDVIDDNGQHFAKHQPRNSYKTYRAYLEAKKDRRYKLRIKNRTNKRIAVVIAVDGRNIISGKKSNLQNTERMYVLGPYQSAEYKGWRTGKDKVNRFYFTPANQSYAAAWGDYSAMGVIAAAVYGERPRYASRMKLQRAVGSPTSRSVMADEAVGTGYGRQEHSASVQVDFLPQATPLAKYFYKYEWRETLCKREVIRCGYDYRDQNNSGNRFWPYNRRGNGAYAPPPPR